MPVLVDSMLQAMDDGEREKAKKFWDNAYAYAMQSVPYAHERLDALNQAGKEIVQQLMQMPEPQQEKMFNKLKDSLVKPIEGHTAKEFDAAWQKLQKITQTLHTQLVPQMPQMAQPGVAAAQPPAPPPTPPLGAISPQQPQGVR